MISDKRKKLKIVMKQYLGCLGGEGLRMFYLSTVFPNRGLCERLPPILKILVSHNLFSVTNNIQSYLLEELNVIDLIVYKADRWHTR